MVTYCLYGNLLFAALTGYRNQALKSIAIEVLKVVKNNFSSVFSEIFKKNCQYNYILKNSTEFTVTKNGF